MADTPKKELTDEQMAFKNSTSKDIANLKKAVVGLYQGQKAENASKMAQQTRALNKAAKLKKRAAENKRYSTEISKLAKLGKPTQMLQGLSDTTKISKTK